MLQFRHWPLIVAGVAVVLSLALWVRLANLSDRLDETSRVVAGLGVRAALVDDVITTLSGSLADQLAPVITELDEFAVSVISIPIDIDQELPIDTEIEFARTIEIPINTSIPINETIETTVTVAGPLGVDIDLDVTVPIAVDVPIDLVVPFEIDEVVPIRTAVPVRLTVPVSFDVAGTPLAELAIALRQGLAELAAAFG